MLLLLWLFQVVFLDDFYKLIKTRTVKTAADEVVNILSTTDDYVSSIENIMQQSDVCVRVIDNEGQDVFQSTQGKQCSMLPVEKINELIANAKQDDESSFTYFNEKTLDDRKEELDHEPKDSFMMPKGKMMQGMTQINEVSLNNGIQANVVVYAAITPVDATVGTIRTQILIITIILFIFAIFIGYIMSKKIARPIIKINDGAKQLANGDYDVHFKGSGYLEIAELNDTLNYASKELAKVENLRRELIANMSHDLRTPLTMISGYGELMRDIPGENTPENIQVIVDETNRLTHMVNDILDLSKMQSGTQNLVITCFSITKLIDDVIERYKKMLSDKPYSFSLTYDCDIFVHADESKLTQVIYNLINNAIHYCGDDHQIMVKQTVVKNIVRVEVIDHGPGIDEKDLPYVWDRYYKVDKTHARAMVGSGLGLSIVKGVLDMHHATYGVTSKRNEGTTFWFELELK